MNLPRNRSIVLGIFALAFAMAGGGWWFRYQASRRAAAYWGADASLVAGDGRVDLFRLVEAAAEPDPSGPTTAGRALADRVDLSQRRGLVHFRYALTQDANFDWNRRRREPAAAGPWRYLMRFAEGDRRLDVLFTQEFDALARLERGGVADVAPCPRLAPAARRYLQDVGAIPAPASADETPATTGR